MDERILESKCREVLGNLMDELTRGFDELESNVLLKAKTLKKTIATLIDQSVSINSALVDKDFLDEFCDTDVKARIQTKIYNSIEEEVLKLHCTIDKLGAEVVKYRSILAPLETLSIDSIIFESDSKDTFINLLNAFEWARDCVQLSSLLHIKLQIAVVSISYDDAAPLKQLELSLNEIKKVKKTMFEKRKAITELLVPFSGEKVKLVVIPETK